MLTKTIQKQEHTKVPSRNSLILKESGVVLNMGVDERGNEIVAMVVAGVLAQGHSNAILSTRAHERLGLQLLFAVPLVVKALCNAYRKL